MPKRHKAEKTKRWKQRRKQKHKKPKPKPKPKKKAQPKAKPKPKPKPKPKEEPQVNKLTSHHKRVSTLTLIKLETDLIPSEYQTHPYISIISSYYRLFDVNRPPSNLKCLLFSYAYEYQPIWRQKQKEKKGHPLFTNRHNLFLKKKHAPLFSFLRHILQRVFQ